MRGLKSRRRHLPRDEFTAAALGDLKWLETSLKDTTEVTYDDNGLAPIHLSALHGRLDCLKLLIEKQKVDVNLSSSTGWRPIHLCISNQTGDRAVQCLLYLLKHSAHHSIENEDGVTPVHQAASEGHIQCLKILIEHGAIIDNVDKRGHKPIDLAKLWGHRKCARILASEQWHQDKAGIAGDLVQLRKEKMEQVLRDLEKEEKQQADTTFYGQLAFSEWLDRHGLPPTAHTEPGNAKNRRKKTPEPKKTSAKSSRDQKSEPPVESTMKPNSVAKNNTQVTSSNTPPQKAVKTKTKPKPVIDPKAKVIEVRKEDIRIETPVMEPYTDDNEVGNDDVSSAQIPERHWKTYENPIPWNTSCKVRETFHEYQPTLPDAYPRDYFTKMPTKEATPYQLNIRHPKIFITDDLDRVKRIDEVLNVRDRLSEVDISAADLPCDLDSDRPVLYHCKAVQDLPKRKLVDNLPSTMVCEGGMHLTNDVHSPLFKAGLLIDTNKRVTIQSPTTAKSSKTSVNSVH